MTLNVSLRVPDGIVLASDSLATLMQSVNQKMNVSSTCPGCGTKIDLKDVQTPPLTVPSSTWPYSQKMFPLQKRFGLATYGSAFVNNRSIYNHVSEFGNSLPGANPAEDHLDRVVRFIVDYFQTQLISEWRRNSIDPVLQPDEYYPFGFHFVGFKKDANGDPCPHAYLIKIGKKPTIEHWDGIGCTWSGDGTVVTTLWQAAGANYAVFSLQDAVDYAKFLIRTTADFQRFSGRLPTVGGEIDIALITNHHGFRWIAQKELYHILDKEEQDL